MSDAIEERFINSVWEVLKRDSDDLRKQQAILRLFREARAASPSVTEQEKE